MAWFMRRRFVDSMARRRTKSSVLAAVGVLVGLTVGSGADAGTERDLMMQCQRRTARVAARFARARRQRLGRCLEWALRCPGVLDDGSATDPCLAAAAEHCREWIEGLSAAELRVDLAAPRCLGAGSGLHPLSAEGFLDEDGLGFELLAPFCPTVVMRDGQPANASVCQRTALACTVDHALASAAPRAADLLQRLGVRVGGYGSCLVSSACGNGALDGEEECDDGPANSDSVVDACRTNCLEAHCGDGVIDSDEECDDGNLRDRDGCDSECTVEADVCGNGVVEEDEECDDGNHRDGDGCHGDCTLEADACGNGVVEGDEECDDGNRRNGDGCDDDCGVEGGACGDGVVENGERCDDGPANSDALPDHCRTDCTPPRCGDGIVDPDNGEQCEPPETLLCTESCEWRFGLPPGGDRAAMIVRPASGSSANPAGKLAGCQEALLRGGARVFTRTERLVDGCVSTIARCVLGLPESRDATACLERATRRCQSAAARRDAVLARALSAVTAHCEAIAVERLLDAPAGLGFRDMAAGCAFAETREPVTADLLACAVGTAQCLGENAVARTIPRAYDLLSNLDLDSDAIFPCVDDPDDFGSASGAFLALQAD